MENMIQKHRAFVAGQIQKSFESNLQSSGEEVEKAWNVGDEKQYQGVTWYVGGFNAKGQPLWRKKKDDKTKPDKSNNADPRDKNAQDSGFKDYKEMRGYQDYVTSKNLLKKRSMQSKTKEDTKKELEANVAKYEKEHADVIKRIAEKKGAKSKSDELKDIKSLTSSVQDAYSKVYNWIKEDEENGNPHSNGGKKILDYLQNIEGNLRLLSQGKANDGDLKKLQDDVKSLSSAWDAVGYGKSNLPISKEDVTKLIAAEKADKGKNHTDVIAEHGGKKAVDSYASMDIKDAKKALVGKVVTLADYWPDGRGGSQDAIGEIKNVRLYGKNKTPIAEVVYPNGDEQMIRLDEIDDGKMKDSYKTAITIGDDKTKLNAIKKKISNNA